MSSRLTTVRIPPESTEYLTVEYDVDGVTATSGVEVSFTDVGRSATDRPGDDDSAWSAAVSVGGEMKVLVGPGTAHVLGLGTWCVWGRKATSPELPVVLLGYLSVSARG